MRLVKCKAEPVGADEIVLMLRNNVQDMTVIHPVHIVQGDEHYIDMDSDIQATTFIKVPQYAAGMIESQQQEIEILKKEIENLKRK